jgi:hypothetical protein
MFPWITYCSKVIDFQSFQDFGSLDGFQVFCTCLPLGLKRYIRKITRYASEKNCPRQGRTKGRLLAEIFSALQAKPVDR